MPPATNPAATSPAAPVQSQSGLNMRWALDPESWYHDAGFPTEATIRGVRAAALLAGDTQFSVADVQAIGHVLRQYSRELAVAPTIAPRRVERTWWAAAAFFALLLGRVFYEALPAPEARWAMGGAFAAASSAAVAFRGWVASASRRSRWGMWAYSACVALIIPVLGWGDDGATAALWIGVTLGVMSGMIIGFVGAVAEGYREAAPLRHLKTRHAADHAVALHLGVLSSLRLPTKRNARAAAAAHVVWGIEELARTLDQRPVPVHGLDVITDDRRWEAADRRAEAVRVWKEGVLEAQTGGRVRLEETIRLSLRHSLDGHWGSLAQATTARTRFRPSDIPTALFVLAVVMGSYIYVHTEFVPRITRWFPEYADLLRVPLYATPGFLAVLIAPPRLRAWLVSRGIKLPLPRERGGPA